MKLSSSFMSPCQGGWGWVWVWGGASVKEGFRLCRKAQSDLCDCVLESELIVTDAAFHCPVWVCPLGQAPPVVTNINNVLLFSFRPKFNKNVP